MNRRAIIDCAMAAANDREEGYDEEGARAWLVCIDADYDWEPELFQAELEDGFRHIGPMPAATNGRRGLSTSAISDIYKAAYEEHVAEQVNSALPFRGR